MKRIKLTATNKWHYCARVANFILKYLGYIVLFLMLVVMFVIEFKLFN